MQTSLHLTRNISGSATVVAMILRIPVMRIRIVAWFAIFGCIHAILENRNLFCIGNG